MRTLVQRDERLIELRRGRGAVVTAGAVRDVAPLHEAVAVLVTAARRLDVSRDTTLALVKEALQRPPHPKPALGRPSRTAGRPR